MSSTGERDGLEGCVLIYFVPHSRVESADAKGGLLCIAFSPLPCNQATLARRLVTACAIYVSAITDKAPPVSTR
jgi:hypothetical protein